MVIEPALIDEVMGDAEGEPVILPARRAYMPPNCRRRDGRVLTQDAYRSLGGWRGVVAQRAEEPRRPWPEGPCRTRRNLRTAGQRPARTASGHGSPARRTSGQLETNDDAAAVRSDQQFGTGALLLFNAERSDSANRSVEIAHQALLVTASPQGMARRRSQRAAFVTDISPASKAWETNARDAGDLVRGARLADAVASMSRRPALTGAERHFVAASGSHRSGRDTPAPTTFCRLRPPVTAVASWFGDRRWRRRARPVHRAEATGYEAQTGGWWPSRRACRSTRSDTALLLALEAAVREQSVDTLERSSGSTPTAARLVGLHVDRSVVDVASLPDGRTGHRRQARVGGLGSETREKLWSSPSSSP